MGYGGNLMWTGVIKALNLKENTPILICKKANFSDLLSGNIYDRYSSFKNDPIFKENKRVKFNSIISKKKPVTLKLLDNAFKLLLKIKFLNTFFENSLHLLSNNYYKKNKIKIVLIDLQIYSYAEYQTKKKIVWKKSSHAIQAIADNFKLPNIEVTTELNFTEKDHSKVNRLLKIHNIQNNFIIFEPATNTEWFGTLRMWPKQNWEKLIENINKYYPDLCIVQIGQKKVSTHKNIINLTGKTSFNEAALLIKKSSLFLCTESGLMHAARAVDANTLVIWGGITKPSFAGYENKHTIISKNVKYSLCGRLCWCDANHICIDNKKYHLNDFIDIHPDDILKKIRKLLSQILNKPT